MKEEPDERRWKALWEQTQLNLKAEKSDWKQALEHSELPINDAPSANVFDDCVLYSLGANDSVKLKSDVHHYLQFAETNADPRVWDQIGWNSTLFDDESLPWDATSQLAAKAVESEPTSPAFSATLGGTLYRLKRFAEAKVELIRSLELAAKKDDEEK
jgi:hypothetical protein